jgi:hypothetical protein
MALYFPYGLCNKGSWCPFSHSNPFLPSHTSVPPSYLVESRDYPSYTPQTQHPQQTSLYPYPQYPNKYYPQHNQYTQYQNQLPLPHTQDNVDFGQQLGAIVNNTHAISIDVLAFERFSYIPREDETMNVVVELPDHTQKQFTVSHLASVDDVKKAITEYVGLTVDKFILIDASGKKAYPPQRINKIVAKTSQKPFSLKAIVLPQGKFAHCTYVSL